MSKARISPRGTSWDDLQKQLFTPEEIEASKVRVEAVSKLIERRDKIFKRKMMSEFQELLQEQLKNPEFEKEWNDIQPEMNVIRAMLDARIEQNDIKNNDSVY